MSPGPVSFEPVTICAHWIGTGKLEVQAPVKTMMVIPKEEMGPWPNMVAVRMEIKGQKH